MTDENRLRNAADAVTGLVKAIPVYEDLAQPAVRQVGMVAGRTVRALLGPLRGLVWSFEQLEELLEPALLKRLGRFREDDLVPPSPTVAVPAIQSLRYTAHEPELREMYFNLLASATVRHSASNAHPAFVEIIRQLTADEAKLLRWMFNEEAVALLAVRSQDAKGVAFREEDEYPCWGLVAFDAGCALPEKLPEYVGNLCRLGLTEIPAGLVIVGNEYKRLKEHEGYQRISEQIRAKGRTARAVPQALRMTAFGNQFGNVCIRGIEERP